MAEPTDLLRRLTLDLESALRAEAVPAEARDRIVARILYGDPDAPHRIYPRREIWSNEADAWLTRWNEVRGAWAYEAPGAPPMPGCPGCGEKALAVHVAVGWFKVEPCGCLFGVRTVPKFGTPVSPSTYLPMAGEPQRLPPGLSREAAELLRRAVENGR